MNSRDAYRNEDGYAARYQQLLECYNRACKWQSWQIEGLVCDDGGVGYSHKEEMGLALDLLEWVRDTPARDFGKQVMGVAMMSHVAAICLLKGLRLRDRPDQELLEGIHEWIGHEFRLLEPCEGPVVDCLRSRALGAQALAADFGKEQVDRLALVNNAVDACLPALESGRDQAFFLMVELAMQHGAAVLWHVDAADAVSRTEAVELLRAALVYCNDIGWMDWAQRCARYAALLRAIGFLSLDEPYQALEAVDESLWLAQRLDDDHSGEHTAIQIDIACAYAVKAAVLSLLGARDEARDMHQRWVDALDDETMDTVGTAVFDRLCCCMRALGTAMEEAELSQSIDILTMGVAPVDTQIYGMVKRLYRRFSPELLDSRSHEHDTREMDLVEMAREYKELHQRYAPRVYSPASLHEDQDYARWLREA